MDVAWSPEERNLLEALDSPEAIQAFLDELPYNAEITCRSPRRVMRDRKAHCMEGALFAAAALQRLGLPPLLVDLRAVRDDDHVIALFRGQGRLGAVGKSNFVGLRYRSPVYDGLRTLAFSYFDQYFNSAGELTLRAYSRPLDLSTRRFGAWQTREDDLDEIGEHLDRLPHVPLLAPGQEARLRRVDPRLLAAGLFGSEAAGLYRPDGTAAG